VVQPVQIDGLDRSLKKVMNTVIEARRKDGLVGLVFGQDWLDDG
jgi:hypothetical protein